MAISDKLKEYFGTGTKVVRGAARVAGKIGDVQGEFVKDVAQGTARAVGTVATTAANANVRMTNKLFGRRTPEPFEREIETTGSPITRAIFGGKSIKDLKRYGESGLNEIDKIREGVVGEEVTPTSKKLAVPLGVLGVAAELSGMGGPAKKVALKLTEEVTELITKTRSIDEVTSILTKEAKLDKKTAAEVAPKLAEAETPEEVTSVIQTLRDRGFTQSVQETIPERVIPGSQIVTRSTDELSEKAANLVKENIDTAETFVKNNTDDNAVAIASELIKKYTDDARSAKSSSEANIFYDKIADITNDMAVKLTAAGRTIQAATILARTTPEGQLRFAARTIQKYNEANPTKKIAELSAEDTKYITDEMAAINDMEDGVEKAMRYKKLQEFTLAKIPTPLWKKVMTTWQAGLLTGLKTTGLNLASTANNIAIRNVAKIPAVLIDKAASLFTGERSVALTFGVTKEGLKEGVEKGARYFKTGFDERNMEDAMNFTRVNFGKGKVGKLFQTYTDTVFRSLGAQDQLFYYGVLSAAIKEQAIVRAINTGRKGDKKYIDFLIQNPDEKMMTAAVIDATSATFQNKTRLGEALSAARAGGGILGQFAIPFARTPSAVAMEVLHYSPIGAFEAMAELLIKGKKFDQAKFSTLLGKSTTGTLGAMWLGHKLYENDRVTLEYPKTARERAMWESEGRKANTVLINGKWRSPYVLGPSGVLILWGAHFKRAMENTGSISEAVVEASFGMGKSFMEQTAMTGVNQMAEALNNPGEVGPSYIAGLVSSFVPTLVSDIGRSVDPMERDTKGQTFGEKVTNRVQARIPGARQALPEKVDAYGYDIERVGSFLEVMVDPTRPSKNFDSPILTEIRRLYEEGYSAAPTKLEYYDTLTQKQQVDLFRLAGTKVEDSITELMQTKEYRVASDEKRADMIDREMTKAKTDARAIMLVLLLEDIPAANRATRIAELWEAGMITEAVYARYKELK